MFWLNLYIVIGLLSYLYFYYVLFYSKSFNESFYKKYPTIPVEALRKIYSQPLGFLLGLLGFTILWAPFMIYYMLLKK